MKEKIFKNKKLLLSILIIILIGFYFYFKSTKNSNTQYIISNVKKDNIYVSVTGSGKVLSQDEIEIKPKISGEIAAIFVKEGKEVKAGDLLFKLYDTDYKKQLKDAEILLERAKIDLQKMLKPPEELDLIQAENALLQAKEQRQKALDDLNKSYEDGFSIVSNAFLDLPDIMDGLKNILYGYDINKSSFNLYFYFDNSKIYDEAKAVLFKDKIENDYQKAKLAYDKNFNDYKLISRFSEKEKIENLILETFDTVKLISEAIKDSLDLVQLYQNLMENNYKLIIPISNNHISNLTIYLNKVNNHLINLLSIKRAIEDNKNNLNNTERLIKEREKYLEKLKKGADELDIKNQELLIKQREYDLELAKDNLKKVNIYSNINGIVSKINIKKGDVVSPSTVLARIISKQRLISISLNEIDVAKVKIGQDANLTFDAFPDFKIKGKIVEISTEGKEEQGVVSYEVKIALEKENKEIKPGMSVNAEIIVDRKENVLLVPNSAIKSDKMGKYVEVVKNYEIERKKLFEPVAISQNLIEKKYIKTGISNDEFTEVIEGLKEGEIIIIRTLNQTSKNRQQTNPFLPRLPFGQQRRQ
jgi:HlyD family secretion protein